MTFTFQLGHPYKWCAVMPSSSNVTEWIRLLKEGDPAAAQQLWEKYFQRMVRLAYRRMGDMPRCAADEEDVAQSAFKSFFRGVEDGRFPKLSGRDDLWQILIMLTARKAARRRRHENRLKRGGGRVVSEAGLAAPDLEQNLLAEIVGREASPGFAAEIADECRKLLLKLGDPKLRTLAVWKMEGYTNQEIAAKLNCVERSVERKLNIIRNRWSQEFAHD
jgi:RNA polymerase sigma factor (sigma-70 family)